LLLLEGLSGPRDVAGVAWPALRGALVSVAVAFGVPVVHSVGPEETTMLIAGIGRQLQRQFSLGYVRASYHPKGWRRRALFILQGLPGIGPRRAAALLSELGSVHAVVSADVATLAQVTGVGLGLARGIRRAVEGEAALSSPAIGTAR
jgi:DNA excision repair protein ERCC-4